MISKFQIGFTFLRTQIIDFHGRLPVIGGEHSGIVLINAALHVQSAGKALFHFFIVHGHIVFVSGIDGRADQKEVCILVFTQAKISPVFFFRIIRDCGGLCNFGCSRIGSCSFGCGHIGGCSFGCGHIGGFILCRRLYRDALLPGGSLGIFLDRSS